MDGWILDGWMGGLMKDWMDAWRDEEKCLTSPLSKRVMDSRMKTVPIIRFGYPRSNATCYFAINAISATKSSRNPQHVSTRPGVTTSE
eukprot:3416284-Rhodomonas_salina.3